jgi:hypothetical protein
MPLENILGEYHLTTGKDYLQSITDGRFLDYRIQGCGHERVIGARNRPYSGAKYGRYSDKPAQRTGQKSVKGGEEWAGVKKYRFRP